MKLEGTVDFIEGQISGGTKIGIVLDSNPGNLQRYELVTKLPHEKVQEAVKQGYRAILKHTDNNSHLEEVHFFAPSATITGDNITQVSSKCKTESKSSDE